MLFELIGDLIKLITGRVFFFFPLAPPELLLVYLNKLIMEVVFFFPNSSQASPVITGALANLLW